MEGADDFWVCAVANKAPPDSHEGLARADMLSRAEIKWGLDGEAVFPADAVLPKGVCESCVAMTDGDFDDGFEVFEAVAPAPAPARADASARRWLMRLVVERPERGGGTGGDVSGGWKGSLSEESVCAEWLGRDVREDILLEVVDDGVDFWLTTAK